MDKWFVTITTFLAVIVVLVSLIFLEKSNSTEEIRSVIETQNYYTEKKIESLEKEIRLLKQDIYILENGYEGN